MKKFKTDDLIGSKTFSFEDKSSKNNENAIEEEQAPPMKSNSFFFIN